MAQVPVAVYCVMNANTPKSLLKSGNRRDVVCDLMSRRRGINAAKATSYLAAGS
jgi:hypothetical protein